MEMKEVATITTKRQLTIPAKTYRRSGLKERQKVLIQQKGRKLIIEPLTNLVEELAGSLSVPKRYRGLSMDEIIKEARKKYFLDQTELK